MNRTSRAQIRRSKPAELPSVVKILAAAGLPTEDLAIAENLQLWVASESEVSLGVIGLERFGDEGLLRSLAVAPQYRRRGLGHELVEQLERNAQNEGIDRLVLLTETAQQFFRGLGYEVIDRALVGGAMKQSGEFRSLCPVSATCMRKSLGT